MTDTELNEKIARLMGWHSGIHGGKKYWQLGHASVVPDSPPDYLASKRIHELLDLAETIGLPRLCQIPDGTWLAEIELIAEEDIHVKDRGLTASIALAKAIAYYAESQERVGKRTPWTREDTSTNLGQKRGG